MKRLLVSIPALFCFAATAAIVMPSSQGDSVVLSVSGAIQTQDNGLKLKLSAPTGPHQIGRVALRLVDKNRTDSLAPTPRSRELMIQIWYPANNADRYPLAPYKTPGLGTIAVKRLNRALGAEFPDDFLTFPTHSRQGAPVKSGKWSIILLSPAAGVPVTDYTGLNEDLASRGFVVVGIDHTFDATVEFLRSSSIAECPVSHGYKEAERVVASYRNIPSLLSKKREELCKHFCKTCATEFGSC